MKTSIIVLSLVLFIPLFTAAQDVISRVTEAIQHRDYDKAITLLGPAIQELSLIHI
jgi:hypothetical protein